MAALDRLREKYGKPLPKGNLIPTVIEMWNTLKGVVDDFSKVLKHANANWGRMKAPGLLFVRTWQVLMYNSWRLYILHESLLYLLRDDATFEGFQKHRAAQETFVQFQKHVFKCFDLPSTMTNFRSHQINHAATSLLSPCRSGTLANVVTPPTLTLVADVQDFLISNRVGASSAANMLKKPRVPKRLDWINDDRLVDFRLGVTPPSRHVILRIEDVPGLTVKEKDKRRNCKWCTDSACVTIKKGRRKTKKVYRVMPTYKSHKYARKTYHACLSCMVPLCKTPPTRGKESCFEKWHRLRYMPSV